MRPRTAAGRTGRAGLAIGTGWSSNSKMRSDDDMADCMTAYLVEKSRIGTKKRCMYSMKATSVPKARAPAITAAVPDDDAERDRAHRLDDREQGRLEDVGGVIGGAELVVQRVEAPLARALACEELNHRHPRQRFLQVGVQPRQPVADQAVVPARRDAEEVHRRAEHRHQRQRDQGEAPVDGEHDGNDADQRREVHQDGEGAGREHLVDHVDIGGEARHQAADRVAVEEAGRQFLQVLDQVEAEVGQTFLRHDHHQIVLQVEKTELSQHRQAVEDGRVQQPRPVALGHVAVDTQLEQVRLYERADGGQRQAEHRGPEPPAIRPDVGPQPADQAGVVGLPEIGLAMQIGDRSRAGRAHRASISSSSCCWR